MDSCSLVPGDTPGGGQGAGFVCRGRGGHRCAFPRAVKDLTEPLEVTGRIAAQTRQRRLRPTPAEATRPVSQQ